MQNPSGHQDSEPDLLNFQDDKKPEVWDKLFNACGLDLGTSGPDWLKARDDVRRKLLDNQSVHLHVVGDGVKWHHIKYDIKRTKGLEGLHVLDLSHPGHNVRGELLAEIAAAAGSPAKLARGVRGLAQLTKILDSAPLTRIALLHFDHILVLPGYEATFLSHFAIGSANPKNSSR